MTVKEQGECGEENRKRAEFLMVDVTEMRPMIAERSSNVMHRVTKITDALNQDIIFTYDPKGNLLTSTDSLSHTTIFAYNAVGQPLSVVGRKGDRLF